MKRSIYYFVILSLLLSVSIPASSQYDKLIRRVVIDAGHGGKDPGASGKKSKEKNIALDIALKTGNYIEKYLPDVEVIYTRKTDKFIPLHERARIANDNNADLFISIHCNANNASSVYGAETYVMGIHKNTANLEVAKLENASILQEEDYEHQYEGFDPNAPEAYIIFNLYQGEYLDQSLDFASKVQDQFRERVGLRDRSVMQAGFWVLYKTAMPSVLIETGYLTNTKDENFLNTEDGKVYIASAIYRAFKEYKREMERNYTPEKIIADAPPPVSENNSQEQESTKNDLSQEEKSDDTPAKEDKSNQEYNTDVETIFFRVQFATADKDKAVSIYEAKGIQEVMKYYHGGLYKFTSGNFANFNDANTLKTRMRNKGYKDAFVVAFKNGERISLSKAKKLALK